MAAVSGTYRPRAFILAQRAARRLSRLALSVHIAGTEQVPTDEAIIIAGNHSGFLDGPLVTAWAPRILRTMTKIEIFRGAVGKAMMIVGQIPVDRDIPDRAALHRACAELAAGGAVGVFPEGTRGDGELGQVKDGIGYLAAWSGVRIVPVAVLGTQVALPKGKRLPRRSVSVHVVFGTPFTPEVVGDPRLRSTSAAVTEEIRQRLRAHLELVRREVAAGRTGD